MIEISHIDPIRSALLSRAIVLCESGGAIEDVRDLLRTTGIVESVALLENAILGLRGRDADSVQQLLDVAREELDAMTRGGQGDAGGTGRLRLSLRPSRRGTWARETAEPFLRWCARNEHDGDFDFATSTGAEVWQYVALAALARSERSGRLTVHGDIGSQAWRFAHAIGFDEAVRGGTVAPTEQGRTVTITRVSGGSSVDTTAESVSNLLVAGVNDRHSDLRRTMFYVLVELLRNVVQHSRDRSGGLVAAQVIDRRFREDELPGLQIVVADNGVGIQQSLRTFHKDTEDDPRAALTKALRPYISGVFGEGRKGYGENAGLGLFFVSEMAKATGGRFLLTSRGATMVFEGDLSGQHSTDARWLSDSAYYPGTLVVVEVPQALPATIGGYEGLLEGIRRLADERSPSGKPKRWIEFIPTPDAASEDVFKVHVLVAAPTMADTAAFVNRVCMPRLRNGTSLCLDFGRMTVLTQSRAHELVFALVREAYESGTPLIVAGACPAVAKTVEFVERYALCDVERRK